MSDRFVIRPDGQGHTVRDLWTGQPAVIAMTAQTGLSADDADHVAALLNARSLTERPEAEAEAAAADARA